MAHVSNYFLDRLVQYPGRVTLTNTDFGTQSTYDVDRAEGTITREGTPFNADTFNRIADEILDIEQYNADLIAGELTRTLTAASGFFSGTIKWDKIGDLVIVYVNVTTTNTIPSSDWEFISDYDIPSGFRPSANAIGIIRGLPVPHLVVTHVGRLGLSTNSEAIPTGTAIKGEVCYFV